MAAAFYFLLFALCTFTTIYHIDKKWYKAAACVAFFAGWNFALALSYLSGCTR